VPRKPADWDREKAYNLWLTGMSGGQIAERLGVTRNAVMGALYRAGFTGLEAVRSKKKKPPLRPPRPKKAVAVPKKPPPDPIKTYTARDFYIVIESMDRPSGFTITELRKNQCRYPVSPDYAEKDSHLFCGKPCLPGKMYCVDHNKVAYKSVEYTRRINRGISIILTKIP